MHAFLAPPAAQARNRDNLARYQRTKPGADALVRPLQSIHPKCPRHRRSHAGIAPLGGIRKRATDMAIAAGALLILAPALLLIAILIKLESPGPIFFLQRRGGFRGKTFLIYKFRTMTTTDDGKSIQQATRDDNRVTRLGAFLRKTSLDELPQLFNVLKGEMSIVGPRPHAIAHDAQFETIEPTYRQRRESRPGITGLAQVSGYRGLAADDGSVKARIRCDLDYIENWSWRRDALIMLRTFSVVLGDKHAF